MNLSRMSTLPKAFLLYIELMHGTNGVAFNASISLCYEGTWNVGLRVVVCLAALKGKGWPQNLRELRFDCRLTVLDKLCIHIIDTHQDSFDIVLNIP